VTPPRGLRYGGRIRTHGRAAHAVDELHCHFVFNAHYHKPVLRGEIAVAVRDITRRARSRPPLGGGSELMA